jgi:NhaP-type Na+/H+ or K+/H+ antiporter
MAFAMGVITGASLGCSVGYVLGAIMRTGKKADILDAKAQLDQIEREPKLPLAIRKSAV